MEKKPASTQDGWERRVMYVLYTASGSVNWDSHFEKWFYFIY